MSTKRADIPRDMMAEARAVRELAEAIKLPDDDEEGRQIIADTETELVAAIEAALDYADDLAAMIDASAAKRQAMIEREKRLGERLERIKLAVASALATASLPRLPVAGELVVYVRPGQKLTILDENQLPDEFVEVELVKKRKINRTWLLAALKGRRQVPGAMLTNGAPTIQRRKQ